MSEEIIDLILWAYKQGIEDARHILDQASKGINEEQMRAEFMKMLEGKRDRQ